MRIEQIDLQTASVETLKELHDLETQLDEEVRVPGDPPRTFERWLEHLRSLPDFVHVKVFMVRDDHEVPIGVGQTSWQTGPDNQHVADMGISVLPQHRQLGIAKSLLPKLLAEVEGAGRTLVIGGTNEIVAAGPAFAQRLGAEAAYRDHTNRLALEGVDRALIKAWLEDGPRRAPGYSLVWHDGPYGDLVDRVVPMHELTNTAPREDLDLEDSVITPERIEAWEKTMFATGLERWSLFAQHEQSQEFAGFTEVGWSPARPKTIAQFWTAVAAKHQGHALGKWLKAAMIDRILRDRPEAEDIRTGNADSNDPMLAINTQLGFEPFRAHTGWQITTEKLHAYLETSKTSI